MPILRNPRREAFAQARVQGMTLEEAYVAAGHAPSRGNAGRMARKPEVIERINELSEKVAAIVIEKTAESVEKITDELNEALAMARDQERPDRMVMAAVAKAKLNGLIVEKSESTVTHKHEERVARRQELLRARKESRHGERPVQH